MVESYVIQIYRRSDAGRQELVGTVERVGTGTRQHFSSVAELWACLNADQHSGRTPNRPGSDGPDPPA